MDCSPLGCSVHGIFQARILEWVVMPASGDLPEPRIKPESLMSPALATGFFTTSTTWEAQKRSFLVFYFIYTLYFIINHCYLSIAVPAAFYSSVILPSLAQTDRNSTSMEKELLRKESFFSMEFTWIEQ